MALPLTVPLPVAEALKRSGQFVPTFYDREWSVWTLLLKIAKLRR